ncbi:MAG TPA: hypothetical protein VM940_06330 [Chthoniobacterales bacterium]|jgi:hypothetical protein|nr:hypothetical protein [Chthoniobacterales bacterium]
MPARFSFLLLLWASSTSYAESINLTIYAASGSSRSSSSGESNAAFAVVRQTISLILQQGENDVVAPAVSPMLDPVSVILFDHSGKSDFRIVQQQFRADVLTEQKMLSRHEGQTIPFRLQEEQGTREVMGKIVRAGYWNRSGDSVEKANEPIIEMDGRYVFRLPGTPIFPKLPDGELLKPELRWKIAAANPTKLDAELIYLTDGLGWRADYNAVMTDEGKISQFTGWITLENNTGVSFEKTGLKLIAGNIRRLRAALRRSGESGMTTERVIVTGSYIPTEETGPTIQRRIFDEYHEYTVPTPVTLSDREMTQVELVRATNVNVVRSFIYDGSTVKVDSYGLDYAQLDSGFGTESTSKVAITSEFRNDASNHLGVPLPEGQVHFFRPDNQGHLQFTGDSNIGNTPRDEIVRSATGYAFDLLGERVQTDYKINDEERTAEESYEIKVRNHRRTAAEVRIWEHPCRWRQWEITAQSQPFKKVNQQTFEFVVAIPPGEEKKISYTIRYTQIPPKR